MDAGDDGDRSARSGASDGRPEGGREVHWSARRKQEVVLWPFRGESLDALARATGQPAGTISGWREAFLQAGQEGLKSRPRPMEERQLADAQRKIGELALDNDILRGLIEEIGRRPRSPSADDRRPTRSPLARVPRRGICTSRKRVLRLMRRARLVVNAGTRAPASPTRAVATVVADLVAALGRRAVNDAESRHAGGRAIATRQKEQRRRTSPSSETALPGHASPK